MRRDFVTSCVVVLVCIARVATSNVTVSAAERKVPDAAVQALIVALYDADDQVRVAAAQSLTQIGEPAIKNVIDVLSSEDKIACSLAAQILGVLRAESAVPELSRVIQDENSAQHSRLFAVRAIGSIFADPGSPVSMAIELPGAGGGF